MGQKKLNCRRDNMFRAWQLMPGFRNPNSIDEYINGIDNDGYTWELTVKDGWVYVVAVKQISEFIEDDNPPLAGEKVE